MDIEKQWRGQTIKDIQEGKIIIHHVERDKDGNTIVRIYTENMLEKFKWTEYLDYERIISNK